MLERQRKRQAKKIHEEELNRKKRIAKLDKELAKLREENRKITCVVCDQKSRFWFSMNKELSIVTYHEFSTPIRYIFTIFLT